jgi:hypothetical protein
MHHSLLVTIGEGTGSMCTTQQEVPEPCNRRPTGPSGRPDTPVRPPSTQQRPGGAALLTAGGVGTANAEARKEVARAVRPLMK